MKNFLKMIATAGMAMLMAAGATPAFAQTYPTKPITVIVPFAAGSGTDISARLFSRLLEQELGQPVIVDNKVGGTGTLATDLVARAPADGYTLLYLGGGSMTQTFFSRKLNTDLLQDLVPLVQLSRGQLFLYVRSDLPVNNIRDFIALVQKEPGKHNYASIAATQMMPIEVLKDQAKLQMIHIPYKGMGQVVQAFEAKDVTAIVNSPQTMDALLQTGKARAVMVFGDERNPYYPDVPTAAEAGLSGVESPWSFAFWAPSKTPGDVVAKLNTALNAVLKKPESLDFLKRQAGIVGGGSPKVQQDWIRREHAYWARAAKLSNFTPE